MYLPGSCPFAPQFPSIVYYACQTGYSGPHWDSALWPDSLRRLGRRLHWSKTQQGTLLRPGLHTFSGWVEAYSTHTEKAREVAKALLRDIIPRYRMPLTLGSDNGPDFVAEIVQQMAKALGIKWNLHAAYCHQSSGKVECRNRSLKSEMSNLGQEANLPRADLLPLVLLWVQCTPWVGIGLSPFKILYGRPPPLVKLQGNLHEWGNLEIYKLQGLRKTPSDVHQWFLT